MRKDGVRVKKVHPEYAVAPHIMSERNDALNMIEVDIPEKPIREYLNKKRKEGVKLSHLSVITAAYTRVLAEYPLLNRFVVNKRIYARNELAVAMVVLKGGELDNGTMSKVNLLPTDTVFDVDRKMMEYIESNREVSAVNKTDKLVATLLSIPGLLRVGVNILKWMDNHDILPRSIIEASPFHASLTISNLASIRTNHIFHHIYNFGTTSVFITLGNMREVPKRDKDDNIYFEKCIPLGVVMDERICSGTYFAVAFRKLKKYLKNPELLEQPPEVVNIETEYKH